MQRFHIHVATTLEAVVISLGFWAIYAQLCILARVSFTTLRAFSFLPLLATAFVLWLSARERTPAALKTSVARHTAGWSHRWRWLRIGGPFIISALYAIARLLIRVRYAPTVLDLLFWLLAIVYLTVETRRGQKVEAAPVETENLDSRFHVGALLGMCLLAALLTSGSRLPNADDSYYLNIANAALEFPDVAPQSFDALHRSGLPPVEQALHLPQVYEILLALLASISGASVQVLYYNTLPPFWAILAILANWLILRHFLRPREAIWGTVIFVFILAFWGDGIRTFGNFSFVRLFQGKAVYISVVLPLIVLAAIRHLEKPGLATWANLALSQCAAAGLTTSGVVVAPIAAVLALFAGGCSDSRSVRTIFTGVSGSIPLVIISAAMYFRMAPFLAAVSIDGISLRYETMLGSDRTPLVLLALTLLPVLAALSGVKSAGWIRNYVWLAVLTIFMPAVWLMAAVVLGNIYSWRLFWAVPVPFLLSLAGGIAISKRHYWATGILAAWAMAFAFVGPASVSSALFSVNNIGLPKVIDAPFAVAKETISLARLDAPALAPEAVAVYITCFPGSPPLIGVRDLLLNRLQGFIPADQLAARFALFRYAEGVNTAMPFSEAITAIETQGIATVVIPADHRDAAMLMPTLAERGFVIHPVKGYLIAARPKQPGAN